MEVNHHLTAKAQRDFELVEAARKQGDQAAYTELMKNYRDTLFFMMLKMTNNTNDAEDLTIEAFGKAFKNLDQYTPDYAFSTWLFKIASNNCIDFIRKRKKQRMVADHYDQDEEKGDIFERIPSDTLDPEQEAIREQKVQAMRDVVDKLKPHYKSLIELRYFREFSYDEIAEQMNLPLGTVKAQLFRARELLYNILKGKEDNI